MPPEKVAPATLTVCGGGPKLLGPAGRLSKSIVIVSADAVRASTPRMSIAAIGTVRSDLIH
jgi:hypothetical protein